jgi:hypothetical protein
MMDIKNYYLGTPLPMYEYMRLPISILPDEIIDKYGLKKFVADAWVYLEIRKGYVRFETSRHFGKPAVTK